MILLYLENETDFAPEFELQEVAKAVAEHILDAEGCPFDCEVSLNITDNEGIRAVNKEFRDTDAPTDVLSFPALDYKKPADFGDLLKNTETSADFNPDTGNLVLGDIMISWERVLSQAEEFGHSVKREFAFLTAHSMLHLLGYDHMSLEEAAVMEAKQRTYLDEIGITREQ